MELDSSTISVIIFAVLWFLFRFFIGRVTQGSGGSSRLPGLDPTDEKGNVSDIDQCGSFNQFLQKLHSAFGPIASFWYFKTKMVSTCNQATFSPQKQLFDRPKILFEAFEPFIGSESVQFKNGAEGQEIRQRLDPYFDHANCCRYLPTFINEAERLVETWRDCPTISLRKEMFSLSLHSLTKACFGNFFDDEQNCKTLLENYDLCFLKIERQLMKSDDKGEEITQEQFNQGLQTLKNHVQSLMKYREYDEHEGRLLVDEIIDIADADNDFVYSQMITYLTGGFHTTGTLMTWLLYYLARDSDFQDDVRNELIEVLGTEPLYPDAIQELGFTRKCIDEAMRLSVLGPYAARVSPVDLDIEGYCVPKNTPIVQSIGTMCIDPKLWKEPNAYNPYHFDSVNADSITCPFFGFAGRRKCPAFRFAYYEVTAFLSVILRQYSLELTSNEKIGVLQGLVSQPSTEIVLKLKKI